MVRSSLPYLREMKGLNAPRAWRRRVRLHARDEFSSSSARANDAGASGDRRHRERSAVLRGQQLVRAGGIGPEEALVLRVDDERNAERERRLLEIDVVVVKVLDHAAVRLRELRIG